MAGYRRFVEPYYECADEQRHALVPVRGRARALGGGVNMTICETLPICPDTELTTNAGPVLTEPVEVGPYTEGVVFVRLHDVPESASIDVDVGISPSGYEDWDEHWVSLETHTDLTAAGVHAFQLSNFGNWLRLRFSVNSKDEKSATVLAWFTGKG